MCLIKLPVALNGLGLILDLVGVFLMLQKIDVVTYLFTEEETKAINKKKNRKHNIGLFFLIAGFSLQLISLFFQ